MRYMVKADSFVQLPVTTGTVQNISNTDVEISNEQVVGSGIVLKAGETFAFNDATIYACAKPILDGGVGYISVVPFNGAAKGGGTYIPKGSVAFASLPTTLDNTMLGWTYNVTDAFTTDDRFVEGAGVAFPAGQNVVVVEPSEGVYKYDCYGGAYILPVATSSVLGGVKSSSANGNVSIDANGVMTPNIGYRQPSTAYTAGQIAYHASLPTGWYLECTTAGTTGSGDLTIASPSLGGTVSDGTAVWRFTSKIDFITATPSGGDCNTLEQTGIYQITPSFSNAPIQGNSVDNYGTVLVNNDNGVIVQYFMSGRNVWSRYYLESNGTWSAWQQQEAIVSKSLGTNGYIKYASGLIVQWGKVSTTTSGATVSFPISFSAEPRVVVTPITGTGSYQNYGAEIGGASTSTFSVYGSASINVFWHAIGY